MVGGKPVKEGKGSISDPFCLCLVHTVEFKEGFRSPFFKTHGFPALVRSSTSGVKVDFSICNVFYCKGKEGKPLFFELRMEGFNFMLGDFKQEAQFRTRFAPVKLKEKSGLFSVDIPVFSELQADCPFLVGQQGFIGKILREEGSSFEFGKVALGQVVIFHKVFRDRGQVFGGPGTFQFHFKLTVSLFSAFAFQIYPVQGKFGHMPSSKFHLADNPFLLEFQKWGEIKICGKFENPVSDPGVGAFQEMYSLRQKTDMFFSSMGSPFESAQAFYGYPVPLFSDILTHPQIVA